MQDTTTLNPGRYAIHNGATHTSQVWNVTTEGVDIYSAPSGAYTSVFICTVSYAEALDMLDRITSRVLAFRPAPEPTIGKARAARLHRIMARLGLQEHYGVARRACGMDGQCYSLAALTEQQARQVWAWLVNMFPLDAHRAASAA